MGGDGNIPHLLRNVAREMEICQNNLIEINLKSREKSFFCGFSHFIVIVLSHSHRTTYE